LIYDFESVPLQKMLFDPILYYKGHFSLLTPRPTFKSASCVKFNVFINVNYTRSIEKSPTFINACSVTNKFLTLSRTNKVNINDETQTKCENRGQLKQKINIKTS